MRVFVFLSAGCVLLAAHQASAKPAVPLADAPVAITADRVMQAAAGDPQPILLAARDKPSKHDDDSDSDERRGADGLAAHEDDSDSDEKGDKALRKEHRRLEKEQQKLNRRAEKDQDKTLRRADKEQDKERDRADREKRRVQKEAQNESRRISKEKDRLVDDDQDTSASARAEEMRQRSEERKRIQDDYRADREPGQQSNADAKNDGDDGAKKEKKSWWKFWQ